MKYIVLFAAGFVIGFVLSMTQCNKTPVQVDSAKLDTMIFKYDSVVAKEKVDSVAWASERTAHNAADSLHSQKQNILDSGMRQQISHLTVSVSKYRKDLAAKDTIGALVECGDIVDQLDSANEILDSLRIERDAIQYNLRQLKNLDSTQISGQYVELNALQNQIKVWIKTCQDLVVENNELRESLKKTKKGQKILAGLGLLAGGVIGHSIK